MPQRLLFYVYVRRILNALKCSVVHVADGSTEAATCSFIFLSSEGRACRSFSCVLIANNRKLMSQCQR